MLKTFVVQKKDLFKTRFQEHKIAPLQPGEVLLRIDKYAFTSNNITYGVFGKQLYWAFFPVSDTEGIIPVWGFADVVISNNPAIEKGERFYGYFPMSDYLTVQPGKLSKLGFSDVSPHRQSLPPIYNAYTRTTADPAYHKDLEDYLPIIKPLFATAFLNYHFLNQEAFFEAKQIVLTSASSKTALGLAFMLKQHQQEDKLKIIGLTSARNVAFVEHTGLYDEVQSYEIYPPATPSVVVDFSGNTALLNDLAAQLDDSLKYISLIGFTDWQLASAFKHPKATMFFAPDQAQKTAKEWGAVEMNEQLSKALFQFIEIAQQWIELRFVSDRTDLENLYLSMLKGEVDPSKGYIVQK